MKTNFFSKSILIFIISFFSALGFVFGNNGEEGNAPVKKEESEKIPVKMSLRYFRLANGNESIKVSAWYKEGKKNVYINNAVINLFFGGVSEEGNIGSGRTDEKGEAVINLFQKYLQIAKGKNDLDFIAHMDGFGSYSEGEEEISIKKAEIKLTVSETDSSVKAVLFQVFGKDSLVPVPETEVKMGIRRMFSILPLGDPLSTDEKGSVASVVPCDIPGDKEGILYVIAKIEDHDEFGTIESEIPVKWGVPVKVVVNHNRTLWASGRNAPIPLVAASVAIVFGIWGVLLYLIFQLFKIKKLSKRES